VGCCSNSRRFRYASFCSVGALREVRNALSVFLSSRWFHVEGSALARHPMHSIGTVGGTFLINPLKTKRICFI
jgi:hypothetical protein